MSISISPLNPTVIGDTAAVRVAQMAPVGRLSLRARGDLAALNGALGLTLPTKIGTRATAGDLTAACLGPDEWVLTMPESDVAGVEAALAGAYDALPHSVTNTSAREVTFEITGPMAETLMTIGCPRDMASMGEGAVRRTMFDTATVVLWRDGADAFRMDVWNSFAGFVAQTLETGCRELAADMARAG